jgi:hypothetical protein
MKAGISRQRVWLSVPVCRVEVSSSISGRAARSPSPFDIYPIPFFLSETVTQSRVATPDSAIAVSLVSTLGGGADAVRENNQDVLILTLGSAISVSPFYSMDSTGVEAKFSKPLSNDFNRLGEK